MTACGANAFGGRHIQRPHLGELTMGITNEPVTGRQATAVVVVVGLLVGGYFLVRKVMEPPTQPTVDEGRAAADAFLASVRDSKAGEAWDASTAEFKSIEGRESFTQKAKSAEILKEPLQFGSVQNVTVGETPRSEFLYTSTKSGKTVRLLIGHEGGVWKVDRLAF
jgi:hypothetical protein